MSTEEAGPRFSVEARREALKLCYHVGWLITSLEYSKPQPEDPYDRVLHRLDELEVQILEHLANCNAFIAGGQNS